MIIRLLLACTGVILLRFRLARADTTLFNRAQDIVFEDAPSGCLAAFDKQLVCDEKVQLLAYDMDSLELTDASLSASCSPSCENSLLSLHGAVKSACGDYSIDFNGASISAVEVVDLFAYKYNMSCLTDSSGEFCLMIEETWDVDSLNASGQATWPAFTDKIYPDFSGGSLDGDPAEDVDGTLLDQSDDPISWPDWALQLDLPDSGENYFLEPLAVDWQGRGHDSPLEYDEYPLEIQCSHCFLNGEKSTISDQVWNNIKRNCDIDWELVPANNQSYWSAAYTEFEWLHNTTCDQIIEYQSDESTTVDRLALANNVPSAALLHLNSVMMFNLESGSYCAPLPCQVAVIGGEDPTSANNFVDTYDNITLTQFWAWNTYMEPNNMRPEEVVCIGPSGGSYTPVSVPQAVPSVYTTTATPPAPTVSGTTRSCGNYYEVKSGDTCADVSLANSIALSDFLSMNIELNSKCTNLLSGFAYCVAVVNGTSASSTPTTSNIVTPTPIQDGMTRNCNSFYIIKIGDGCYDVANANGISLDDFYSYNPAVGDDCSKLYPDNCVCVGATEPCSVGVNFQTTHDTEWGKSVWAVGSIPELGEWDTTKALMLTGSSGDDGSTKWQATAQLPANTPVSFKFFKLQTDVTPVWEEDPNRDFTTSDCGGSAMPEGGKWHDGSAASSCTSVDVEFEVLARTAFGEAVYVICSVPGLGTWGTDGAKALAADGYTDDHPSWKGTVSFALGQDIEYKFIKIGLDGSFTWEADPNRQLSVPSNCDVYVPVQGGTWQ